MTRHESGNDWGCQYVFVYWHPVSVKIKVLELGKFRPISVLMLYLDLLSQRFSWRFLQWIAANLVATPSPSLA